MNQKIKFLRETLNLKTKEICSFLNVSTYKYVTFEKSGTAVPCDVLLLLSRTYGVDIYLLIESRYSNDDLLLCLKKQGLVGTDKEDTLKKLTSNMLQGTDTKLNYHSLKNIKNSIQENIIEFIFGIIEQNNMSVDDFAVYVGIDKHNITSILAKKRFIEISELVKISEKSGVSINAIIGNI